MHFGLLVCLECHRLDRVRTACAYQYCKRCGAKVTVRKNSSLSKTCAFLFSAVLIYIPANILPILTVKNFGQGGADTIFSGIVNLMNGGMFFIAFIVFVASLLIPALKLIGMIFLVFSIKFKIKFSPEQRVISFRFIEWIGRWSMLDIFVIAILVAVVNFGNLANIEAGVGAIAFSSVVVLTMLAAVSFDPRLIWDNVESDND